MSIGMSPFHVLYGYDALTFADMVFGYVALAMGMGRTEARVFGTARAHPQIFRGRRVGDGKCRK